MSSSASDTPEPAKPLTCTRARPCQATSYMAFRGEPLEPDDPLLGFRPVPSIKNPRRNALTPARQRAFISMLAACGVVVEAARHIGASTEAMYKLRNRPGAEEFAAAWDAALDRAMTRLEAGTFARALYGEERMVVSGGKLIGTEMRHNDNLAMFFLRNRRGERYAPDWRALKPGHPLYDKIAAEAVERYKTEDEAADEQAVLDSIDEFLEGMRQRRLANEKILAEQKKADEAEDAVEDEDRDEDGRESESD